MTVTDDPAKRVMEALRAHLPLTLLVDLVVPDGPGSEEIAAHERTRQSGALSSEDARLGSSE